MRASKARTGCQAGKAVEQALERMRQTARPAVRRHSPKMGAVCGKAARTVLWGGALSNERPYRDRLGLGADYNGNAKMLKMDSLLAALSGGTSKERV